MSYNIVGLQRWVSNIGLKFTMRLRILFNKLLQKAYSNNSAKNIPNSTKRWSEMDFQCHFTYKNGHRSIVIVWVLHGVINKYLISLRWVYFYMLATDNVFNNFIFDLIIEYSFHFGSVSYVMVPLNAHVLG